MKKKTLRAEIRALRTQLEQVALAEKIGHADRKELLDRLADAGLILVKGARTHGDRLRAARAGVIVLDDVQLLHTPQVTMTQEALGSSLFGPWGSLPDGPIRTEIGLEFTGNPEILDAISQHFHDR